MSKSAVNYDVFETLVLVHVPGSDVFQVDERETIPRPEVPLSVVNKTVGLLNMTLSRGLNPPYKSDRAPLRPGDKK